MTPYLLHSVCMDTHHRVDNTKFSFFPGCIWDPFYLTSTVTSNYLGELVLEKCFSFSYAALFRHYVSALALFAQLTIFFLILSFK